ncbi:LuxR C-terminal-related transcriptional regulator [Actinosynnema sp. NPDC053489]|uniref:helix-turn-helix transcriptional regulator n=1 Tax=Actinosynnema sp. NPDC053489 TaxID=3363916 RepID=UPI0037C9C5C3
MGHSADRPWTRGSRDAPLFDAFLPLGEEEVVPVGHGDVAAGPACAADRALRLLVLGRDWVGAMRCAEEALEDESCRSREVCVARALSTLIYGGELVAADEHSLLNAGRPEVSGVVALLQARIARLFGDVERAHALLGPLTAPAVPLETRMVAVGWAVELLAECGDVERARELAHEHRVDEAMDSGIGCRPVLLAARGAVAMAEGRPGLAVAQYLMCGRDLIARGVANPAVLPWRSEAALAAFSAGRDELAVALARQEYEAAVSWGESRTVGRALCALAVVDADGQEIERLSEAGQLLELAQAWPELGRAHYELGIRLSARGDVVAARQRLHCALALARETGNPHRAQLAERALAAVAAPPRRPALTRQQARIAELVVAGYSNREIATKLFLALRTVEFHLSNTYEKLGVTGRDELRAVLQAHL